MPKRKQDAVASSGSATVAALSISLPSGPSGLRSTTHGDVFQLKLLILFLIRTIAAGYQFQLGTEIPGMGGKFDDLIFKYQNKDATATEKDRYRYLQAKHKQEETTKITASQLFNNSDGDFSLCKYFLSYRHDVVNNTQGIIRPEDVDDCVICTNIGFENINNLREKGIELIPLDDKDAILSFENVAGRTPTRYKLQKTDILRREMLEWSDIRLLAKALLEQATESQTLTLKTGVFKRYHVALFEEKVIERDPRNSQNRKLHQDFVENKNLTRDARKFRDILAELTFVHYWNKLTFKVSNQQKKKKADQKKLKDFDMNKSLNLSNSNKIEIDFDIFDEYLDELKLGNAIVIEPDGKTKYKKPFPQDFFHGTNLSSEVTQFRSTLRDFVFAHYWKDLTLKLSKNFGVASSTTADDNRLSDCVEEKDIDDFLAKLVFAVDTPNEVQLDDILKAEIGDRYNLLKPDFQSSYILEKILNWFKEKDARWLSSKEGDETERYRRENGFDPRHRHFNRLPTPIECCNTV